MTFDQIFDKAGLYVADSFRKGVCFRVDKYGNLNLLLYKHKDDIHPSCEYPEITRSLVKKTYRKVFTRQELFK